MKKLTVIALVTISIFAGNRANAQAKFGHIDMGALFVSMPEYKKADTALAEYQNGLNQYYADMVTEFNHKDSLLSSKDTLKYSKTQLQIQRKDLGQLYVKIQGWNQQAQQMYDAKQNELLSPVQKKAQDALEAVAKENGYTYVFNRASLAVAPPVSDDLMPLMKKKLGIN